ncbi:MAG TPA: ParA family protein, partial [Planctomycetota bacterium]|nr:ParA family protein [Planctomycetota bacterium]
MTVVALVNVKGGVGKTTFALNLAHAAAGRGAPTLLWDLDAQGAASWALRTAPGPVGAVRGLLAGESSPLALIKGTDFPGLDLLPADLGARRLDVALRRADGGLPALLAALGRDYRHVLLDLPPGLSHLFESAASASDVLLVPTPPTAFSVRALALLVKHVRRLPAPRPRVLAALSMVEDDSPLHAEFRQWSARQRGLFLETAVPLSPVIERLTVERAPVAAFAPDSEEAALWTRLWDELLARAAQAGPPRAGVGRSVKGLLARLDPAGRPDAAPATAPGPAAGRRRRRLALALRDEADWAALLGALHGPAQPVRESARHEHRYDTAAAELRAAGCALALTEQDGRFVLVAEGPAPEGAGRFDREAVEIELDGKAAREILLGRRCPLDT